MWSLSVALCMVIRTQLVQARRRRVKVEDASAGDAAAAALALESRLETAGQPAAVFVEGGLLAEEEGVATVEAAPVQPGTRGVGEVASATVRAFMMCGNASSGACKGRPLSQGRTTPRRIWHRRAPWASLMWCSRMFQTLCQAVNANSYVRRRWPLRMLRMCDTFVARSSFLCAALCTDAQLAPAARLAVRSAAVQSASMQDPSVLLCTSH